MIQGANAMMTAAGNVASVFGNLGSGGGTSIDQQMNGTAGKPTYVPQMPGTGLRGPNWRFVQPTYMGSQKSTNTQSNIPALRPYGWTPESDSLSYGAQSGASSVPTVAEQQVQHANAKSIKFGYRSDFYNGSSFGSSTQMFSRNSSVGARTNSQGGESQSSGGNDPLVSAITDLTRTIKDAGNTTVSNAMMNQKITQVMSQWLKDRRVS
jgi:hypothetical protein